MNVVRRWILQVREAQLEQRIANGFALIRETEQHLARDRARVEELQQSLQRVRNRLTVTEAPSRIIADALRRSA